MIRWSDGKVFTLAFDEPLTVGIVGVRWSAGAGDAHPIDGSFSFTVDENAVAAATATDVPTTMAGDTSSISADTFSMSAAEMAAMADFLQVDQSRPGHSAATVGRLISIASIVLAIGALAFAFTTLRGTRSEIETLITAVRVLRFTLVVGAAIEYFGVARIARDSLTSVSTSSPGVAPALRAAAGLAIAMGVVATTAPVRPAPSARTLSFAVNTSTANTLEADFWEELTPEPVVDQRRASSLARLNDRGLLPAFIDPGLVLAKRIPPVVAVYRRPTTHAQRRSIDERTTCSDGQNPGCGRSDPNWLPERIATG